MKRFITLFTVMIAMGLCCTSCRNFMYSHNVNSVADGKVFRVGTPEINLLYVKGTLVTTVARENSETVVETNNGDTIANPTGSFRGLTTARFRTAGQVSGYLVDLAKKSPDAALKYVENMPKMNKAAWDSKQDKAIDIEGASKAAEEIINPFDCNGNCDLKDLWKNNTIAYQQAVATKLLNYTDETAGWEGEASTFRHSLQAFLTRLAQLTAMGRTVTQMRVKYAVIKDNKIVDLMYIMIEPDGTRFDTHCPECVLLDE